MTDLDIADRLGATHLEIFPNWRAYPDPNELARIAKDRNFIVWSTHGCWGGQTIKASRVDLGSLNPATWNESLDDLKDCLDWLRDASGTCLVVHPGGLSDPDDSAARREALIQGLNSLADHVRGTDLTICVENMPPGVHPGSRMADLTEIVEVVNRSEIRLALDTGHANLGLGIESEALSAGHYLRTTHVHDNNGRSDSHLLPGEGILDWDALASALDVIKYEGPIMLECIRELRKRPESIDQSFQDRLASLCGICGDETRSAALR